MRQGRWLTLAVLAFLLLVAGGLQWAGSQRGEASGPAYSTYTSRPDEGLYYLYRAAQAAGYRVERFEHDPSFLTADVKRLVMWHPGRVKPADWQALTKWVRQGGVLVLADPQAENDNNPLALQAPPHPFGHEWVSYTHPSPLAAAAPAPELLPSFALKLHVDQGAVTYLADAGGGSQLVGWPVEKGYVYQAANPTWFTGDRLAQGDNLQVALWLLGSPQAGRVAFDEFHHGYHAPESWWQILRPNLTFALIELALALVLAMWAVGGRMGRPVHVPVHERRESHEYVTALAGLLRQAHGGAHALAYTRRRAVTALRRRLGVGPQEDDAILATRYAGATGQPPEPLVDLLRRTLHPQGLTEAEVLEYTVALQQLVTRWGKSAATKGVSP